MGEKDNFYEVGGAPVDRMGETSPPGAEALSRLKNSETLQTATVLALNIVGVVPLIIKSTINTVLNR